MSKKAYWPNNRCYYHLDGRTCKVPAYCYLRAHLGRYLSRCFLDRHIAPRQLWFFLRHYNMLYIERDAGGFWVVAQLAPLNMWKLYSLGLTEFRVRWFKACVRRYVLPDRIPERVGWWRKSLAGVIISAISDSLGDWSLIQGNMTV